jgi:hypothetical protein
MKHYLFFVVAVLCTACTTTKVVEQHHHHYQQEDTVAIQARIDQSLNSWHEQMDSSWRQTWQEYSASLTSNEDQKEHITETVTTYIDSLGREVRQEQRTIDRTLSKMQQQTEQRLSREFEARLSTAIDSVNDVWQLKFEALQTHWEKSDSTDIKEQPVVSDGPRWYQRWWQKMKDNLLIICIAIILVTTCHIWIPWIGKVLRKFFPGIFQW